MMFGVISTVPDTGGGRNLFFILSFSIVEKETKNLVFIFLFTHYGLNPKRIELVLQTQTAILF